MTDPLIIPFQPPLPQVLPTIEGNVDYRDLRDQLLRIDGLLIQSGLETQLLEADLKSWLGRRKKVSAKAQQNHQLHSRRPSQLLRSARSEEHTSELQSPDHLVCR